MKIYPIREHGKPWPVDEAAKRKLDGHEVAPPGILWDAIEDRLPPAGRQRPVWLFASIAAGLFGLSFGGYLLLSEPTLAPNHSPGTAAQIEKQQVAQPGQNHQLAAPKALAGAAEPEKTPPVFAENSSYLADAGTPRAAVVGQRKHPNAVAAPPLPQPLTETAQADASMLKGAGFDPIRLHNPQSLGTFALRPISLHPDPRKGAMGHRWTVGVMAGIGFSQIKTNEPVRHMAVDANAPPGGSYETPSELPILSQTAGISASYSLGKHFELASGLYVYSTGIETTLRPSDTLYTMVWEGFVPEQQANTFQETSYGNIENNFSVNVVPPEEEQPSETYARIRHRYIQVPLELTFVTRGQAVQWYASAGGAVRILESARLTLDGNYSGRPTLASDGYRRLGADAVFGAGARIAIGSHATFNIGFRGLKSLTTLKANHQVLPSVGYIVSGISYAF